MLHLSDSMALGFLHFLSEQQQFPVIIFRQFLNCFFFILKAAEESSSQHPLKHQIDASYS